MKAATLSRWEGKLRPLLMSLPPAFLVRRYSEGRPNFLEKFCRDHPASLYEPPDQYAKELWGIRFRSDLMNAAGMFKNGEGYTTVAMQGAGAYMAGTTTARAREGNSREGCRLPFAPYPKSGAASNWLGLPNKGHAEVARVLAGTTRIGGCPIAASLMADPGTPAAQALPELVEGMRIYDAAGVDMLEINESCPNVESHSASLEELAGRLEYLAAHFLRKRGRRLPVVVKFSTDTDPGDIPALLDMLVSLGFDGVNFGNTSTAYARYRDEIAASEHRIYDYFTTTFKGGLSGRLLKKISLDLGSRAGAYLGEHIPGHEFHVIRTGGIESAADVRDSRAAGIALNQWYTGYFESFSQHGHDVYAAIFEDLEALGSGLRQQAGLPSAG